MGIVSKVVIGFAGLLCAGTLAAAPALPKQPLASAALPELLIPVEQTTLDRFAQGANYFLRKQLYFAKRYRIVKINFDVLEHPGVRFTVTPFADLALELEATRIDRSSPGGSVLWQGRILSPAIDPASVDNELDDQQRGSAIERDSTVDVAYRWAVRDVRPELAQALERTGDLTPRIANAIGPAAASKNSSMKMRLMTMSAVWDVSAMPTTLRFAEIEEDPRYHVVYEEDPGKLLQGPEYSERARRFQEFVGRLEHERAQRGLAQ